MIVFIRETFVTTHQEHQVKIKLNSFFLARRCRTTMMNAANQPCNESARACKELKQDEETGRERE